MVRIAGIIFILLILTSLLCGIDFIVGGSFIFTFLKQNSLEIMGTVLALNIATATFLVGQLMNIELQLKAEVFTKSKKEIKHNIMFMIVVFVLQLMVLTAIPGDSNTNQILILARPWIYRVALFLFLTYVYALYELSTGIFSVCNYISKLKK